MEKCQKLCDHALSVMAEMQPLSEYGWKINTKEKKAECKPRCELHPQLTSTTCLYHFDKDSINRLSNIKSSLVTAPSSGHIWHLHLHEAKIFPFTYFVTRYLYTCLLDLWGYLVQCLIPSKVPPFFLTAQQEDGRQQQQRSPRGGGGALLVGLSSQDSMLQSIRGLSTCLVLKGQWFRIWDLVGVFWTTWGCGSWHTDNSEPIGEKGGLEPL